GGKAISTSASTLAPTINTADKSTAGTTSTGTTGTGTTGSTFTLTTGTDNKVGTSGDDAFDGSLGGASGSTVTFSSFDTIDGGAGNDTLYATVNGGSTTTATTKNLETLSFSVSGAGATTVDLANSTGYTKVINTASAAALTVSNITAPATTALEVSNTNLDTTFTFTSASVSGTADAATVNVKNVSNGGATAISVAGIETLTLNSTGGVNAFQTITDSSLTKLIVTGDQNLTLGAALATTVTNVDASALAAGLTATLGAVAAATISGGTGKDVLTIGATTKAIDLGAGDNTLYFVTGTAAVGTGGTVVAGGGTDTLGMTVAAAVTASASSTFATKVTGFERLTLAAASANPQTVDVATLLGATNQNYVTTTGVATNVLQLSNLNASGAGATVVIKNANGTANAGVTLNGSTGSTSSDVLNLTLSDTATTTDAKAVVTFGTIDAANVETVKITVSDARTTSVNYQSANTATITDAALQSLVVSGNQSLVLTHTAGTALTSVDASGMTVGSLSFTSNASQYATTVKGSLLGGDNLDFSAVLAAVTLTETAGANTVQGGVGADTIVGGTGADVIYADNAGTNEVQTATMTYNASANDVLTVNGVAITAATGANLAASTLNMTAAINASAALKNIVVATDNNAAVAGEIRLTWLTDGNAASAVDTTSSGTTTVADVTP
ncbi:MAG: hypothetical protein QX192_09870, partial [Methylococcales bacterium]